MSRSSLLIPLILVLALGAIFAAPAAAATDDEINAAIDTGKKFLYGCQQPDGTWEGLATPEMNVHQRYTGFTCMILYALLSTGENEKDPRLAKAIDYTMRAELTATYPLSFQALALGKLSQKPEVHKKLLAVCNKLISGANRKEALGLYGYNIPMETTHYGMSYFDNSNSQYGLLGVWAAFDAGIEIPDKYWDTVRAAWCRHQNKDGGWGYSPDDHPDSSLTMTAAGIATLFITDDQLSFKTIGDLRGNQADPNIDAALRWITPHMPKTVPDAHVAYLWYGMERIAIASGLKYFGDVDWFKLGTEQLLEAQDHHEGYWMDGGKQAGTAFAILFLYRGRGAVVMNKLRYDKDGTASAPVDGNWNERARDAAGVARFIGDQLELFMNWQVVNLVVDPDELHDAPILYIAGNEKLKFSPEQEAKLKRFIEDGGMLLANADGGSKEFSDSFQALVKKLVDGKYEFRKLPDDHLILTREQFPAKSWQAKPILLALSNGVRELAILIPASDLSRAWHTRQFKSKREAFELISDIYLYAVDRLYAGGKSTTYVVEPDKNVTRWQFKLARIQYPGNWDPEPGGWRRLSAVLHNGLKVGVDATAVKPGEGQLTGFQLAHLTGTGSFALDSASRDEIEKFVRGGGTLVVDAAGGSKEFADAAEKELKQIFSKEADQLQAPLPLPSALFPDLAATDVKFRAIVRTARPELKACDIRGITLNGRVAVFFSREDLTAGLVGENIDGVIGYTPESATKLMTAIVLDAMNPPAATQPAQ